MVKMTLESPHGDVEAFWATPVGEDLYRLENSPFLAYGVSWLDVVEAKPDVVGQLAMLRVAEKSGHRTVRLILKAPASESSESSTLLERLQALGRTYEGVNPRYVSVDIPPETVLSAVTDVLVRSGEQWEHADPTYDELLETGELVSQIPGDSGEHTFTEAQICVDEGSVASWQLYEQQEQETFVFSYPFLQPVWKINDIELTGALGEIRVRTNCAFPSFDPAKPDGPVYTVREHESTIHFQQFSEGPQIGLRLRNTATDGRYGVLLEVGVRPAGGEYIRVASAMLAFDGLLLESPFFAKYKECMEKFARPSEKYAPSKPLLPHDLWGPGSRIRWYEQQLQYGRELLARGSIAESEFEQTAAILKKQLAIGPGR